MRRLDLVVTLLTLAAPLLGATSLRADQSSSAKSLKPLLSMYGRNSKITQSRLLRLTTKKEWQALWKEHRVGAEHVSDDFEFAWLDFDRVMVVAIFEGQSINCAGFTDHSIREDADRITIRVHAHTYQSGIDTPPTQAWGIFVLPRSSKAVVLERDVRGLIEAPPRWEEWITFPPLAPAGKP